MVQVEHKQDQHLQCICGQQAMVRAKEAALIVAPGLDLWEANKEEVEMQHEWHEVD